MMRFLAFIGFVAVIVGAAAATYFFGGFYSVAGTVEDPALVHSALVQVRQASINRHATDTPPGSLDNPTEVQAGAHAFAERGCINCHGGPGVEWAKWSEGLRPGPPDLTEVVPERTPRELFWVIKNGINMTAMPSFALAGVNDQEIWTIVAFLRKLPTVSPEDFKTWTTPARAPAADVTPPGSPPAPAPAPPPAPPPP